MDNAALSHIYCLMPFLKISYNNNGPRNESRNKQRHYGVAVTSPLLRSIVVLGMIKSYHLSDEYNKNTSATELTTYTCIYQYSQRLNFYSSSFKT